MLRHELEGLEESIRDDERFLDDTLASDPGIRGQATVDLRERIAEGRIIRDRLARLIDRMDGSSHV